MAVSVMQFGIQQSAQWQWGWEAVGTIGATVVALGIALREGFIRRSEHRSRARLAAMMIWPDLRKYLAALKALKSHEVLTVQRMADDRKMTLQRICGALMTDADVVASAARDLSQPHADMLARVIANVRHALRHSQDILIADGGLSATSHVAKQQAIKDAISAAQSDLIPLIRYSREMGSARGPASETTE